MQVAPFFTKWLKDLAADQNSDGSVPYVIPNVLDTSSAASAGWSDASTVVPWNMYLAYGDTRILEQQYASMKAWVGYMEGKSRNDLWNTGSHFGDWLFYRPQDDNDGRSAVTDKYLIAQAYYAHSTELLLNAAKVLGRRSDVLRYEKLLQKVRSAFLREYVTPGGHLVSGTQTAYVLALDFDLLPPAMRPQAALRLVENVHEYDNHITTGFLGTPHLCRVLTRFGYVDVAYALLMQKTYPSWLYPVTMGATTIWERWDGIRPDGSFQNPGDELFQPLRLRCDRRVAVPDPRRSLARSGRSGLQTFPHRSADRRRPDERLCRTEDFVRTHRVFVADFDSTMTVDITIPPNTSAEVVLPDGGRTRTLGSGVYHFDYPRKKNAGDQ